MTEGTPKYGLTRRTRKPVHNACNDLSQAINSLYQHHTHEHADFDEQVSAARAVAEDDSKAAKAITLIEHAAARLRANRHEALQPMLAIRSQLVDAQFEGQEMLPDTAMFTAFTEADQLPSVPKPLLGIELDAVGWVTVLGETYRWTRDITLGHALRAAGPAYLLGQVIEHPTPEASKLREDARTVGNTPNVSRTASQPPSEPVSLEAAGENRPPVGCARIPGG